MFRRTMSAVAICLLVTAEAACASKISGDQVMASVKKTFSVIRDYSVDAKMAVKGPGVDLSGICMRVYYKKPDKVHVEAGLGAFMTPPERLLANPIDDLTRGARASYVKTQRKEGCDCHVVKLTAADRPTVHLWVDRKRCVIVATRTAGKSKAESIWRYKTVDGKYCVPTEISAVMRTAKDAQPTNIKVSFSNYTINKGVSDKVFEH